MNKIYLILLLMAPLLTHSQDVPVTSERTSYDVNLYPNPVSGSYVNVTTNVDSPIEVKIFDVFGEVVHWQTLHDAKLDVSKLLPGVYVLQLKQGQKITSRKLVKK